LGHEVMTMTGETELKARAELAGCGDRPHQVQTARAALASLEAPNLHAALEATRSPLGQGSAQ
jgi:hypothetical protein